MSCPSSSVAQAVALLYVSNMSHFVPRVWPPTILRALSGHWQDDRGKEIRQGWGVPMACEHPEQGETYLRRHHHQQIVDINCGPLLWRRGVSTHGKGGQPRRNGLITFLPGVKCEVYVTGPEREPCKQGLSALEKKGLFLIRGSVTTETCRNLRNQEVWKGNIFSGGLSSLI